MQGLGKFSSSGETVETLRDAGGDHVSQRLGYRVGMRLMGLLCVAACMTSVCATSASAKLARKYLFAFGPGQVAGIAIDQATEDVFVYSPSSKAIFKFNALGTPVNFSSTGTNEITGAPSGSTSESEIAVDGSSGPAKGDIYLAHADGTVVIYNEAGEKAGELKEETGQPWGEACGVAVGSSGAVYVGLYPSNVDKFVPTSAVPSSSDYVGSYAGVESVCNVAVDPAGNLFSDKWSSGPITAFPASQLGAAFAKGSVVDESGTTLTVDPATEDLFVDERRQVSRFGPNGKPYKEPLEVFTGTGEHPISGSFGIGVSAATEDVYVGSSSGVHVYGSPVILPEAKTGHASNLASESATVSGEVAPEGLPIDECYFEYGESSAYGQKAVCAESENEIGTGNAYVKVHAELTSLTAGVQYHYRLVVANENGSVDGSDASFEFVAPVIENEFASNVTATSGDIDGSVNPKGIPTRYHFEYGPTAAYGASTPTYEVTGEAAVNVQWLLQELAPETTCHYRLVAESGAGPAEGPDKTFTTEGAGGLLMLLDGREWEMVSSVQKYGAGIIPQRYEGDVIQAAEDGSGLVYMSQNPIENEPEGNRAPEPTQILARRLPGGGWSNRTMTTASESSHGLPLGVGTEYKLFSPNLSEADMQPTSLQPLAPRVTQRTPYLRNEAACQEKSTSCFTPMLTAEDTAPGAVWDPGPEDVPYDVNFVDASKDTTHVLLKATTALLEGAPERGVYEWSEGHLQLVSVNAAGEPVAGEVGAGELNVRGAISNDGKRVFFCEEEYFGCAFGGELYARDTETRESVRLDPPESSSREFQIATEDGSRVFYTYSTYNSTTFKTSTHLMACKLVEVGGKLTCERTEVAPSSVGSVIGIDTSGNTIYFVSEAELAGEAVAGEDNLYVSHLEDGKWEPTFIATLSHEDELDWATHVTGHAEIDRMTSRVSPNGQFLAFMSDRSLTGYDNHDAVSGEPDQEVFLYDAQTGKLTCPSCNPTGARPHGLYYSAALNELTLVNSQDIWERVWVAASLPGWDNISLSNAIHQTSYLSNEGRLFFNSSDALVPQDSNGLVDVYESEPDGVGSCGKEHGCVGLVSSGTARTESVFLDASASGDDVFFITTAQLTGEDHDTAYDVYDAHVCTTAVPCEQAPASPPPCSTGESCKPAPTPQPSIYGAPASATFSGAGNPPRKSGESTGTRKKPKGTGAKRRLQQALKKCKRKDAHKRARERRCEAQARKRYGGAATHHASKKSREARSALAQTGQNRRGH